MIAISLPVAALIAGAIQGAVSANGLSGISFVKNNETFYNPTAGPDGTKFIAETLNGLKIKSAYMDIYRADKATALRVGMPCAYGNSATISCYLANASDLTLKSKLGTDGIYYVKVESTDVADNKGVDWKRVVLDRTAPVVTTTQPIVDAPTRTTAFTFHVESGISEIGGMAMQVIDANGNDTRMSRVPCYWKVVSTQDVTCKVDIGLDQLNPASTYTTRVIATDKAGNTSSPAPVHTIRTAAPTPQITTPAAYTNTYQVTASWNAVPGAVSYDYGYWNDIATSSYRESNPYIVRGLTSLSTSGVFNQGEGVHYLAVRSVTADGVVSPWSVTRVVYDKTAPAAQVVDLATTNPTTVSFHLTDAAELASFRANVYTADGKKLLGTICDHRNLTGTEQTISCDIPQQFRSLSDGNYIVKANVIDRAGNNSANTPGQVIAPFTVQNARAEFTSCESFKVFVNNQQGAKLTVEWATGRTTVDVTSNEYSWWSGHSKLTDAVAYQVTRDGDVLSSGRIESNCAFGTGYWNATGTGFGINKFVGFDNDYKVVIRWNDGHDQYTIKPMADMRNYGWWSGYGRSNVKSFSYQVISKKSGKDVTHYTSPVYENAKYVAPDVELPKDSITDPQEDTKKPDDSSTGGSNEGAGSVKTSPNAPAALITQSSAPTTVPVTTGLRSARPVVAFAAPATATPADDVVDAAPSASTDTDAADTTATDDGEVLGARDNRGTNFWSFWPFALIAVIVAAAAWWMIAAIRRRRHADSYTM